ncbi:MAG: cystathionine gamma-synthase [Acidimicrobiales bacterium]|jgi:cystathionine gamma-synthase
MTDQEVPPVRKGAPDTDPPVGFGFETRAIHAGQAPDGTTGAVVTPIFQTSTFAQPEVGAQQTFEYSRTGNPTRTALETCLADLEGTTFGAAFASGLAAEDAVFRCLEPGDHVIIGNELYGGTYRLLDRVHSLIGLEFTPVALHDADSIRAAWRSSTRMVWMETPSNPQLHVSDIASAAELAHGRNALVVVDNTFATPYLQRPVAHGADVVVHSTTKYLSGHSDVVGGFVATSNEAIAERIAFLQNATGAVPGPFDCFLVLRGIKTLAVRMDRHCRNAVALADVLATHPAVERLYFPGLPSHIGHDTAKTQMQAFGGMVSFTVRGGEAAAIAVANSTRIFTLAESLGAVESLIDHPHRMTHASLVDSPLAVDPALLRLSVGLEAEADLISDLRQALEAASGRYR